MDISGTYTLYAPREQVWDAMLDPDTLKRTIPGCESLEQTGANEYAVRMNIGVAGVKGVYDGTLHALDAQRPDSFRMVVDGTGARGILHGDGTLQLEAKDAGTTVVHYAGQAQLGGAIASVGMRVAGGAANMLIKQYFIRLADLLPATNAASTALSAPQAASTSEMSAPSAPSAVPAEPPRVSITPAAPDAPVSGISDTSDATDEPPAPVTAPAAANVASLAASNEPTSASTPMADGASVPSDTPIDAPMGAPGDALGDAPAGAPVDSLMPPPTAPIHPPQPPQPAPAMESSKATAATAAPSAAPRRTALMNLARRSGLTDGTIESEQKSARTIGAVIVIGVVIIVALIIWFIVTR